jgi:hypothetical protein
MVTAIGQLVGLTVQSAIAAFHRLDAESIAGAQRADGLRLKERRKIVAEAQTQAETDAFRFQVGQTVELEIAGQWGFS